MNKPADAQNTAVTSQLDRPQRAELEEVVSAMRKVAERDIEHRLVSYYDLKNPDTAPDYLDDDELDVRAEIVDAIDREQGEDHSWTEALRLYVKGCGYTLVNRVAAFRCMEVRGFMDRAVTRFRDDGQTPAADPLTSPPHFLQRQEAIAEGYRRACQSMTDEIEILFDPSSPYSLLDGELDDALFDTFEELCRKLDDIPDDNWRADDVLGWVYEYYNVDQLDEMDVNKLETADEVSVANQFYTPHWVVRMLTDNSLGKLFLEHRGELQQAIQKQEELYTAEERKTRGTSPDEAPTVTELCTYLVPTEEEGEATATLREEGPEGLRVLDPACGSGHFLLYAFDILERIWWSERPNVDRAEVPAKILEHNLYGVDLDMRACQLAAFNLYLKARARAEAEGEEDFHMPSVGIVCADVHLANLDGADEVFDEVADGNEAVRELLEDILDAFESIEGLGSLLDLKGTLSEGFFEEKENLPLFSDNRRAHDILELLHAEVQRHRGSDSFRAKDLKSFLRLLVVLSQDYDVTLMNPPYGTGSRMPQEVHTYIEEHYEYAEQFYINFFEVCHRVTKSRGRVGMLVPWSFMFKKSFRDFRQDFLSSDRGAFDFLAEFGYDILDNATVSTVGTVVRVGATPKKNGVFIRLSDVDKEDKEGVFVELASGGDDQGNTNRTYFRDLKTFQLIPGAPITYWVPTEVRKLFAADTVLDASNSDAEGRESLGSVKEGVTTGNNRRFLRRHWEIDGSSNWRPFAKGGAKAWMLAPVTRVIDWSSDGAWLKRYDSSYVRNQSYFGREALTYTYLKRGGRRFSIFREGGIFGHAGKMFFPDDTNIWSVLAYANSWLFSYLMLAQTSERHWEVGKVSNIPWLEALAKDRRLIKKTKQAFGSLLALRQSDSISPHFQAPWLLRAYNYQSDPETHSWHPHRDLQTRVPVPDIDKAATDVSLQKISIVVDNFRRRCHSDLEKHSAELDQIIFEEFGISDQHQTEILREIDLRTIDTPTYRQNRDPASVDEVPDDFPRLVKNMLHHLAFEILQEDDDGVVPLWTESEDEESAVLERMVDKFETLFGEHAHSRLEETDQILGDRSSAREAYPNLRGWLEEELFDFHLSQFENTPILWKVSTKRLASDPVDEGFACIVDYHQMDGSLFATIRNRYLKQRESALRERRANADRRSSDTSLSAEERSAAETERDRCRDAIQQIQRFKEVTVNLKAERPRDLSDENRELANSLADMVSDFRRRTEERLETLDEVEELMSEDDFVDHFSPTFKETVDENREEWLDALDDLEEACGAYAQPTDQPVEAHLYDLFVYFDDLVGSTHYASKGIFFVNYYFEKGEKYLEAEGQLESGLEPHEKLLAELARETGRDIELGEDIKEGLKKLRRPLESDWKTRALQEVMTEGWNPVKKHGVAINIEPLADAKIVPEIVEDKVI